MLNYQLSKMLKPIRSAKFTHLTIIFKNKINL
jgi:hypothetical protein